MRGPPGQGRRAGPVGQGPSAAAPAPPAASSPAPPGHPAAPGPAHTPHPLRWPAPRPPLPPSSRHHKPVGPTRSTLSRWPATLLPCPRVRLWGPVGATMAAGPAGSWGRCLGRGAGRQGGRLMLPAEKRSFRTCERPSVGRAGSQAQRSRGAPGRAGQHLKGQPGCGPSQNLEPWTRSSGARASGERHAVL